MKFNGPNTPRTVQSHVLQGVAEIAKILTLGREDGSQASRNSGSGRNAPRATPQTLQR